MDSLTGESKINFTSTNPAENYDFIGESITLKPLVFTLDVDGNENVIFDTGFGRIKINIIELESVRIDPSEYFSSGSRFK